MAGNAKFCPIIKVCVLLEATKIDEIFTIDLTVCSICQIDSEDFVKFCGLLGNHELCQNFFTLKPRLFS